MFEHAWLLMGAAFLGVLAVYGLSRLLEARTASFRARHRIWTHAVAAQFVLAALLFAIGPAGWPAQLFTRSAAQPHATGPIDLLRSRSGTLPPPGHGSARVIGELELVLSSAGSWESVSVADDAPQPRTSLDEGPPFDTIGIPSRASLVSFLIAIWFAGTLFLLVRLLLKQLRWWYGMRRSAVAAPPSVVVCVERLAGRAAFPRRPRVVVAPLMVPAVTGIFRPLVVWPESAEELIEQDPEAAQAVLAHELAHLRHRDPLWKLLAHFLSALLWWHPAVWWTRRRLHDLAEFAADEAAIAWGQDRVHLANGLVRFASDAMAVASVAASGEPARGLLRRRVAYLLEADVKPQGAKRNHQLLVWTAAFATWLGGSGVAELFPSGEGGSVMAIGLRFWHRAVVAAAVVGASLGWHGLLTRGAPQEERERQNQREDRESTRRGDEQDRDVRRVPDGPRYLGGRYIGRVYPEEVERARDIERLERALSEALEAGREEAVARIERELAAARRELAALIRASEVIKLRARLGRLQAELREAEEQGHEVLAQRLRAQIEELRERIEQASPTARQKQEREADEKRAGLRRRLRELVLRLERARIEGRERDVKELEREIQQVAAELRGYELRRARQEVWRQLRRLRERRERLRRQGRERELREIEGRITLLEREAVILGGHPARVKDVKVLTPPYSGYVGVVVRSLSERHIEPEAKAGEFAQRLERAVNILRLAGLEDMAELLLEIGRERLERLQHPEHREREEREAHEREEREEHEHKEHRD